MYARVRRSLYLLVVCAAASAADQPTAKEFASKSAPASASALGNPVTTASRRGQSGYDVSGGRALYSKYCESCHQAGGEGLPGAFPPLKGSAVVNRGDATKHLQVVLNGLRGARVSGVVYVIAMPAFASTLNDADIAAIVDYERSAWGNHGSLVSATQVRTERLRSGSVEPGAALRPAVVSATN